MLKERKEQKPESFFQSGQRVESDTKKLVRLHLQDPNHVITEEEIRNLRVGMAPSFELSTRNDGEPR